MQPYLQTGSLPATLLGELTIGYSHEYVLAVHIFDNAVASGLILDYAETYLRVPSLEIAEQWHEVYAGHSEQPYLRLTLANGVRVIAVTSNVGMTMSFGLAEQTFGEMGVAA